MYSLINIPDIPDTGFGLLICFVLLIVGILCMVVGGDWLVKGGLRFAKRTGAETMVVGLTIIAFSTSAPELSFNILAAGGGHGKITLGNIFGSNIANLGLVLGIAAIVHHYVLKKKYRNGDQQEREGKAFLTRFFRQELGWLIFSTLLISLFIASVLLWSDNVGWLKLDWRVGIGMLLVFFVFFDYVILGGVIKKSKLGGVIKKSKPVVIVRESPITQFLIESGKRLVKWWLPERTKKKEEGGAREEPEEESAAEDFKKKDLFILTICKFLLGGLLLLGFGGKSAEIATVSAARICGISEIFIGVTIVAIATSLPELVTTIVAVKKNAHRLALGNIIGSNLFNLLFVLPITMFFANAWSTGANGDATGERYLPIPDGPEPWVYMIVMLCFTFIGYRFMKTDRHLSLGEGGTLVGLYVLFLTGITICGFTIWKSVT